MNFPDLLSAPEWRPAVVALLAVTLITLLWSYVRCVAPIWIRIVCAGLKGIGVFLLGLCLLEPMQISEVPKKGANLLIVMADTSQSMQVRDAGADVSREEMLRQRLTNDDHWQETLDQSFELRKFAFARQIESTDFDAYEATGIGSSIAHSLETISQRYRGRPVAGIVMMTDGNATDQPLSSVDWSQMPPVYPVVVGRQQPESDISINRFSVSQTNFEAAPVSIAARVKATGDQGNPVRAQLLNEAGEVVDEQPVNPTGEQSMATIRFKVRPEKPGVSVYRLRVAEENQFMAFDDPEMSSEATMVNNERTILVDRARGPYRILYVSGRPNWEFKFLRRALQQDDEIDLVGLIRIAREEPKFTFRSHRHESTNPLFRGFGNEEDEEAERYDEPVLVRIGTRDSEELRDGFPIAPEELFQYQAIVLDDVEAEYFTEDQKSLLQDFVVTRGGGFLMLGGQESFHEGGYDRTPLGELLPVYVDQKVAKPRHADYQLSLTREGWLQPWVRIESTEPEEERRLQRMPHFRTVNPVRNIKPGASVLARVQTQQGQSYNALVAHRMGKGRAAALLIGDFWRWHLASSTGDDDLLKAWRQMMRWLVADVPRQVDVQVKNLNDANLSVKIEAEVRDDAFQPLDNATVNVVVTRPDGTEVTLMPQPQDESPGVFGITYVPRLAGAYRLKVIARASDGSVIGDRESGWVSEPANAEFRELEPNREFLQSIADQTGGEVMELDELDRLASHLPQANAPVMETQLNPWWHHLSIFLVAIGCLVGEWGLRRWKGLP